MNYNYFVDISSVFFITFILGTALHSIITNMLDWLNSNKTNVKDKTKKIISFDKIAKKLFTPKKIKKALEYKRTADSFSDINESIDSTFSSIIVMFGISPFFINLLMSWYPSFGFIGNYMIYTAASCMVAACYNIPFSMYGTFKIEGEYGFNNTPKGLFFMDIFKGFLISLSMSLLTLFAMNYVFTKFGPFNPMSSCYLVAGFIVFGMTMEYVYMNFIMKLFNKFEPLKNRKLKTKIEKLLKSYGYDINKVFVMDGSKRSNHSNAFIGGIGKSKKIVLFDTLLKNMSDDEIIAILGHELAHGKLHHLIFNRILSAIELLITVFIAVKLMYNPNLYHAFGYTWVTNENVIYYSLIGFNLSMLIIGSIKWILEPFESYLSRKMEYAADKYSILYTNKKKAMITSLLKLSSENLSDLFPNEYYEAYHYSHPSIINRIEAIKKINVKSKNKKEV